VELEEPLAAENESIEDHPYLLCTDFDIVARDWGLSKAT
jgi:hypothetical protein